MRLSANRLRSINRSSGAIERYKHRETRRYLNIDAETGEFYLPSNGGYIKVPKAAAFAYVFM